MTVSIGNEHWTVCRFCLIQMFAFHRNSIQYVTVFNATISQNKHKNKMHKHTHTHAPRDQDEPQKNTHSFKFWGGTISFGAIKKRHAHESYEFMKSHNTHNVLSVRNILRTFISVSYNCFQMFDPFNTIYCFYWLLYPISRSNGNLYIGMLWMSIRGRSIWIHPYPYNKKQQQQQKTTHIRIQQLQLIWQFLGIPADQMTVWPCVVCMVRYSQCDFERIVFWLLAGVVFLIFVCVTLILLKRWNR